MKHLSLILCVVTSIAFGVDGYVGAHIQQPDVIQRFIQHLPKHESLMWQAWCHLQRQDYEQANHCFIALAELDDPQGYRGLADSYLAGHGFAPNIDLALVLYEKAGALGLGPAQVNAAVLHADRREWTKAEQWFQKALSNPDMKDMKEALEELYHRRMKEKA